jgi:methionyl-tRNA formyltransferase
MRIVLIGQAAFAEKVLQKLCEGSDEIVAVYTTPDIPGRVNPLKELASELKIPVFQPGKMRDPAVYTEYVKLKSDLNILAFVTDILPENILNYPKLGSIQYHPSLLPKHRGGSAINWAVINGETKTGITIFWPDNGIDTGPILLQKEIEIAPDDTVGSLYFNKLFPLGINAMIESIDLVKKGAAPRIIQDESQATYERLCTEKDAIINWEQTTAKVYNLIRGTNPQPGATTRTGNDSFKIFDVEILPQKENTSPGEIIDITKDGFAVATSDGAIMVKRVQMAGKAKMAASEFAQEKNLIIGHRLG